MPSCRNRTGTQVQTSSRAPNDGASPKPRLTKPRAAVMKIVGVEDMHCDAGTHQPPLSQCPARKLQLDFPACVPPEECLRCASQGGATSASARSPATTAPSTGRSTSKASTQRVSPCRIALLVKYLLVLSDLEQSNIFRLEKITQSRAAPSCPAHIHPVVIN